MWVLIYSYNSSDCQNVRPHTALPSPTVMITINGSISTGSSFTLTCVVGVVKGLVVQPTITWTRQSQFIIGQRMENDLTIQFNPINTSDAGQYTCTAAVEVESISLNVSDSMMTNITLQSKPLHYYYYYYQLCKFRSPRSWDWSPAGI